ncbi:FAD-binding protein [Rhodocytophaga rosea]|uniref:FAD-binding protein n=1 Tax=Rhodocytophaga rosea TaxID=2704465 RepID=A0A6C0GDF0_9BACT|nr:FAD-binding and (Fe-S)-binding domain-containing protein [Rhodocytophaga rosea]QHT65844.1 FAD-binding protein [Rhodocytophaga rosea]
MLDKLLDHFSGELYYQDNAHHRALKNVYATDASVYQEQPLAVAIPKTVDDLRNLISFAYEQEITLIPRAAGTSLAGQVVGSGIVTDISKHFTKVLEVNQQEQWVRVQPGVIRDDLNAHLKEYGLMFGPETSTSSRAMIGGMIGNNSCGLHSIIWGATRDNLLEVKGFLADGSEAIFGALTKEEFYNKCRLPTAEGKIYQAIEKLLSEPENQEAIQKGFPKKNITRRNTGYALDYVLDMLAFEGTKPFNMCKLIAGSEGTLFFVTEAKLKLLPLPPKEPGMVAIHTNSIHEALLANLIALRHQCSSSELVDDFILEFTKTNIEQSKNRFFIEGEPKAILMVEFFDDTVTGLLEKANTLIEDLKKAGLGYAYPVLLGDDSKKAWELRKAGLGLLRNLPGDTQCVNLIEDCAVDTADLPSYIAELETLLKNHGVRYSMYAHAGAGELHVEPMINLKTKAGKGLFRTILQETSALVKKYNGSLSGEHGDGRLRGEFIPFMMGDKNYALFKQIKNIFDPKGIFNRGKIVDTPPMNEFLRYQPDQAQPHIATTLDFSAQEGILHLAEKCSGSGDCRKTHITGGTMCPSYMATRSERDTTRARANMLRHFYTGTLASEGEKVSMEQVKDVLDLCLSCKGCKSECPSSVDVGKMKAEFTQQYYDTHGIPLRSRLISDFTKQMKLASLAPWGYNLIFGTASLRQLANNMVGFHPKRTMPKLYTTTLREWWKKQKANKSNQTSNGIVYLFCDEFTNYNDVEIGQKLILLLQRLGYQVEIPQHLESARTYLSKGLVKKAKEIAIQNVEVLSKIVTSNAPIIGIEPSAILTLRDEYLDLVPNELKKAAVHLASCTWLFDEWFANEIDKGNIRKEAFTTEKKLIKLHGHCHQKALSSLTFTKKALSLPANYELHLIPSGCCGMAGSFGYEKEHYDVSMQIGELVLFPTVRKQPEDVIIAAPGTSCRHQIKDGTGRIALHPAEILYNALL